MKGKKLAFLLRHDKDYEFLSGGWREISDLTGNHGFTLAEIKEIVETNNKKRFEFSPDMTKIRARQGHSVEVDVDLPKATPPKYLYHGTATRFLESIREKGILKGTRLHVHLSRSEKDALEVGRRHGTPTVIKIDCESMVKDGVEFFLSRNGVWLTDDINPKYFVNG